VEELGRRRSAGGGGDDVLGAMVAAELGDDAAVDEILALLMAGQEPPSMALTWLLDRLARHEALAERVLADPTGPDADRIRRETLRVRPAVAGVLRRLTVPTVAGDLELPAGTVAMLPIPFLHRDPRVWGDGDAFRPSRFAGSDAEAPPTFMPFGGGERRCLGEHLAHAEMDLVLPAVLGALRLRPLWPRPERMVVRATVLAPHRSAPVIAHDRRSGS
jgi:cytochrome P450